MNGEGPSTSHPRMRLARPHSHVEVDAFSEYLNNSYENELDDQDDQPTPKLSANVALTAETPAARLRALLSRVPNNKPIQPTTVPPFSSHLPQFRSDLVDSDVDASDEYQRPLTTNHSLAGSSSTSFARESLRDIFTRARREPGETPQKDKTPKPRRNSFDELDSIPKKKRSSGKRKSFSDEEPPNGIIRQPSPPSPQSMSIDDLRERLLVESQTQLQDQLPPSLYESSEYTSQQMNISQGTAPFATSTPHAFPRRAASSVMDSGFPSHLNSQMSQSNLLDPDSEMRQAMENVEEESEHNAEYNQVPVPFPHGAPAQTSEPPTPPSTSSTPGRSRIPLTRSRLNSLDNAYAETSVRRASGEHHRSISRTSSIASLQSNMSLCSDEAERIRERERDWNKPKPPVRPSTPELKQGHIHGRFSSRKDSPMVGGRRNASIGSLEDLSSNSIGSQAEYHERLDDLEREMMHDRERQWNKRRPRLSHSSPNSSSIPRERVRAVSLTHVSRPDSATSMSSTASPQRQHSFSPSSGTGSPDNKMSDPPEEYLQERERNWNSPRPRWLQSPVTSSNGRRRAHSLRSNDGEYDVQRPSTPLSISRPHSRNMIPHRLPPDPHSTTSPKSSPPPHPASTSSRRQSHIPVRSPMRPVSVPFLSAMEEETTDQQRPNHVHRESENSFRSAYLARAVSVADGNHLRAERADSPTSQDVTPTIQTAQLSVENQDGNHSNFPRPELPASSTNVAHTKLRESPMHKSRAKESASFLQSPPRSSVSSHVGSLEFQSPPPPQGLPELPGPPSVSDEEEESDLEYSSIAWERTSAAQENAVEVGNSTTMKTPRPPGAWLMTPAPSEQPADAASQAPESSIPVNETEYDGGLATPVPSLSRTTGLQTPALPGAWVPTPATITRKSILKVRFEPPPSESTETESSAAELSETSEILQNTPKNMQRTSSTSSDAAEHTEYVPEHRSRTPDLQPPTPAPISPKSPRKSPKIRVLDAFGREAPGPIIQKEQTDVLNTTTPRNNSIRMVDAMGREILADLKQSFSSEQAPECSLPSPPPDRREALVRVRQGLSDLAQGIDEIYRATTSKIDESRVQELDELSRKARARREELAARIYTAEADVLQKAPTIRGSKHMMVPPVRRTSWIPTGPWVLWFALLQAILLLFMYRFSAKQARDIFLSTYYDAFHPDLHLYTIRPDTTLHRIPSSGTSWLSMLDALRRHGWRTTFTMLCDNVTIFIYDLRTQIWETWGEDSAQQIASWPPT